ncbi:MAG: hypothetical protein V4671_07550, partial [Armatimonadota bacterium]
GATVQAPECVLGWMLRYQRSELESLVRKINEGKPVLSRTDQDCLNWESVAALVMHHALTGDEERDARLVRSFANLWRGFAADFLNRSVTAEINSLRHGLRIETRGSTPPEGDDFRSLFYAPEKIDRYNFRISCQSLSWNPHAGRRALRQIALSIGNIISSLKIGNGAEPGSAPFHCPTDEAAFEPPAVFTGSSDQSPPETGWVAPLTAEDIRESYSS